MKKTIALVIATLAVAFLASCTLNVEEDATVSEGPATVEPGPDTVTPPVEPAPAPEYTLSQQNAIAKGEQYLSFTAFSRTGLITQLEYEGFTVEEATFAVDTIAPDWNQQAALKAEDYLEYSSFSRDGLYDQLIFEGFSDAEAQTGLAAVGY